MRYGWCVEEAWSQGAAAAGESGATEREPLGGDAYRQRGEAGLRQDYRPCGGRKPRLEATQLQRLTSLLLEGPESPRFPDAAVDLHKLRWLV